MNKLTKIVATIGPSSDSHEMIEKLIKAGVNIFRFNFKHNTIEWHEERMNRVRDVADALQIPIGTLIDLQGPSIRTNMPFEEITFEKDEKLYFGEVVFEKQIKGFSLSHPEIINELNPGQKLLINDGVYTFILERENETTFLIPQSSGSMKNKRNVSIPGSNFSFPILIDRDLEGLALATRVRVDFVALSFVRTGKDIEDLREEMKKHDLKAKVIAKIETQVALDNMDEIVAKADGIMVARGDMGVELPAEQVPFYQKKLISKCIERGKSVITATQMLQSMVDSPIPTRAEVSDVANAVYDFTDAVMLSQESATGKYALESVNIMQKIAQFTEKSTNQIDTRTRFAFALAGQTELIADAAYNLFLQSKSLEMPIAGFIVFTQSGTTARVISRYRPGVPIYAFTGDQHAVNSLTLNYGVIPLIHTSLIEKDEVRKDDILMALSNLEKKGFVKKGESYIVLHGDYWMVKGGTSTIKIVNV